MHPEEHRIARGTDAAVPRYTDAHTPAGTSFPLFGVGQADPLCRHGADVVAGVKVGLLNLASIDHIDNVIYSDAVRKSGERRRRGRDRKKTKIRI